MNNILFREQYLESAVMICITNINGEDFIILEKRAENIRQGGEVCLPGGKKDKKDISFKATAIRETIEELGVEKSQIFNVKKFGILFSITGVILECFTSQIKIKKISDIKYNKDEVENILFVPLKFFLENKPVLEEIEISNKPKFNIEKYNFPSRYSKWNFKNRKIYIFMFKGTPIWGITAEILIEFSRMIKEKGNFWKKNEY